MRSVRIHSLKNQAVIADKCHVADSFVSRFMGLMGKSGLEAGEGIWLRPCNSIHMWFMRFPIDVVFVRSEERTDGSVVMKVCSVHESVAPWRPFPIWDSKAREALELPAGTIRRVGVASGDELCTS